MWWDRPRRNVDKKSEIITKINNLPLHSAEAAAAHDEDARLQLLGKIHERLARVAADVRVRLTFNLQATIEEVSINVQTSSTPNQQAI